MKSVIFGVGLTTGVIVSPAIIIFVKPIRNLVAKGFSKSFASLMEKSPAYRKRVLDTWPDIHEKVIRLEEYYRKMDNAEA